MGVEVYHCVLKSSCRAKARIERCLAIDMVVAWRVFRLTMLARECPELPAPTPPGHSRPPEPPAAPAPVDTKRKPLHPGVASRGLGDSVRKA